MRVVISIVVLIICQSCGQEQVATPKPRQYPRVNYPVGEWNQFSEALCPFVLDIPSYNTVVLNDMRKDRDQDHPCWFDIVNKDLGAIIHCSYYEIGAVNTFDKLREDAYTMASKHNIKASYRDEIQIETKQGSKGILFKIEGLVATPYQFYITDEEDHFLRGSLYFEERVEIDSVGPVIDFLREDINKIVGSVVWQE